MARLPTAQRKRLSSQRSYANPGIVQTDTITMNTVEGSIPFGDTYGAGNVSDQVYNEVVKEDFRNGFMSRIDKRTWYGKRITDVYLTILSDNAGGENLSTIQLFFCRQMAHLIVLCEDMSLRRMIEVVHKEEGVKPPKGDDYILAHHLATLKTIIQLGKAVGIKRVPKDLNPNRLPTLKGYAKAKGLV